MPYHIVIAAIFGLLVGSFLNVCIFRVPRKMSVLSPYRSFCPGCETQLHSWHNIPVISWLILFGKCHFCKSKISGQYPLVELLSSIAAAAAALRFGITPTGCIVYALSAALIVITFIDLEFKIIPNVISFPGMVFGLLLGIAAQYTPYFEAPLTESAWDSLLGFLFGGGFFYAIGVVYFACTKRVGLGGGDIKLMAMTGAILGVESVPPSIFIGSLVGATVGIVMMLLSGGGRHMEIPFGPWLAAGVFAYLYADTSLFQLIP